MARGALIRTIVGVALLLAPAHPLHAQMVEIAPFVGARIGGEELDVLLPALHAADIEHAASVGVVLNVPLSEGLQIEGEFSHQPISLLARPDLFSAPLRLEGGIDHWQGGALQEYLDGAVRPFLTGVLGLTRYAVSSESAYRFTVGGGGGVKLFPVHRVGVRLDGRVFTTFLDAATTGGVCGPRGCIIGLHLDVAWELEFTAALVIRVGPALTRS